MAQAHVRKGDTVVVIAGRERGKRGKHQRPTQKLRQGGIIEREAPLHLSNVMLLDPRNDKPTRVGIRQLADGTKARIARKSGEIIDKV